MKYVCFLTICLAAGYWWMAGSNGNSRQYASREPYFTSDTLPEGNVKPDSIVQMVDTIVQGVENMIAGMEGLDSLLKKAEPFTATKDTATAKPPAKPTWDKRWFVSPLLKFQAQDFGMLEKNRVMQLSQSHALSFRDKSTLSFAASAYKNLSGRFSFSVDLGLGNGHVTSDTVLVENTKAKTYNLANAAVYIHLLGPQFRLQPYITGGVNGLIGDESYVSAPVGAGFKFTGKKLMVNAQASYGMGMTSNIANSMVYAAGIYIPLKNKKAENKKKEQKEEEEKKPEKKDSSSNKGNGITTINIVNNYYYGTKDSSQRSKKEEDPTGEMEARRRKKAEEWGDTNGWDEKDDVVAPKAYDPNEPMTFRNARKFVVYFEYDDYALTASAFREIDHVARLLRQNPNLRVHLKGHTDLRGSGVYNTPLSQKRATMVYNYMLTRGISKERMIVSYYGKDKPVTEIDDPDKAWLNRRTELVLYEKE